MHVSTHTLDEVWAAMTGYPSPTLEQVASGLATVPRWLGRTIVPFSVLQHSLAADRISGAERPEVRLAILMHDSEEMILGDIPSPAKTAEQAEVGEQIRRHIYQHALGSPYPTKTVLKQIEEADILTRHAEAHVLLPGNQRAYFPSPPSDAMTAVEDLCLRGRKDLVDEFIALVEELQKQPTVRALRARG